PTDGMKRDRARGRRSVPAGMPARVVERVMQPGGTGMSLASVRDYRHPAGWANPKKGAARARHYCEQLEAEQVVFFDTIPFEFPEADREFLLSLRWSHSRYHKNISYKPGKDQLGGFASEQREEVERVHRVMRDYSGRVTAFLTEFLAPYAPHWKMDFASF